MTQITAAMVKELRERTGQGMMDCKKALEVSGGDIEKAIDDMRSAGAIKAAKKAGNIALLQAARSSSIQLRFLMKQLLKKKKFSWR